MLTEILTAYFSTTGTTVEFFVYLAMVIAAVAVRNALVAIAFPLFHLSVVLVALAYAPGIFTS